MNHNFTLENNIRPNKRKMRMVAMPAFWLAKIVVTVATKNGPRKLVIFPDVA